MKCLVTGCAGFIGSNLVDKLLKEGFEVFGIDCFSDHYPKSVKQQNIQYSIENKEFTLIEDDILSCKKFPEVDWIFHLAAYPGVRKSWIDVDAYIRNNIVATQRLLEFYKNRKLKFIYASSSSIYGESNLPMNENAIVKPLSPYAMTKLAAENLCYMYCKNFNIHTISLRYFTVYGERQRPDMAIYKFINNILKQKRITVLGDGEQTRDFTYVGDVIEANLIAANSDLSGEVLNVGSENRTSIKDVINSIEQILGRTTTINYSSKNIGDVKNTQADSKKIRKLLSWNPKVKFEEGLKRQIEWMS